MNTINFEITSREVEGVGAALIAGVVVLVDGKPLCGGVRPVVDVLDLLTQSMSSGEFFPYTCSCGEAGCAGYFEGVKVAVDAHREQVVWHIPNEMYAVSVEDFGEGPWALTFDKKQMAAELASLEAGLQSIEGSGRVLLVDPVDPSSFFDEDDAALGIPRDSLPFSQLLSKSRKVFFARRLWENLFEACFQEMSEKVLGIDGAGDYLCMTVRQCALAVAEVSYWSEGFLGAIGDLSACWLELADLLREDPRRALLKHLAEFELYIADPDGFIGYEVDVGCAIYAAAGKGLRVVLEDEGQAREKSSQRGLGTINSLA